MSDVNEQRLDGDGDETIVHDVFSSTQLARWRAEFPMLAQGVVHLANCSQSPVSLRLRAGVERYLASLEQRGLAWDRWLAELERAKRAFARLINADPGEVAISTSVSAAVSSIAGSIDYADGRNRIVTTDLEFPTIGHIWLAAARLGARVQFLETENNLIDLDRLAAELDDRTRLVSITHVHYGSGALQDVAGAAAQAHAAGALVLVDSYQAAGVVPIDVKALGVDFLVSGTLKYLLGIPGIAFVYVRRELIEQLRPVLTGWLGQRDPFGFKVRELNWATDARRLETGTGPVIAAYASAPGIELLSEVGIERIQRHSRNLTRLAFALAGSRGLTIVGPNDPGKRGSILGVDTGALDAHQVEELLAERGVIASARGRAIRLAPHFFTMEDDLTRAFDELATILG